MPLSNAFPYRWALSGGGRGIVRVEVSTDGGKTWQVADLLDRPSSWAERDPSGAEFGWTRWSIEVPAKELLAAQAQAQAQEKGKKGQVEIVCRAVDTSYSVQPESVKTIWNMRGLLNSAWHHVHITIQ